MTPNEKNDQAETHGPNGKEETPVEVLPPDTRLVRSPAVPTTVDELAALQDEGKEIIEARVEILKTLRLASIRATNPQDWLLFKAEGTGGDPDRVTAYLQDSGAKRIMPLWSIDITPPEGLKAFEWSRVEADGEFAYSIFGDGYCGMTRRSVRGIEGLRYSTDDFCNPRQALPPIVKEMRVKQAARANLDGNIVRRLTGLQNVAVEELEAGWQGTGKTIALCPKGKGYGSRQQREGARVERTDQPADVKPPLCEHESCNKTLEYRSAGEKDGRKWGAYWRCPLYQKGNGHSVINDSDWRKAQMQREPGQEG